MLLPFGIPSLETALWERTPFLNKWFVFFVLEKWFRTGKLSTGGGRMSDRWVFLAAFLTTTFVVAAAFAMPQFFFFELVKSAIFIAIAVMVFQGENHYSYMLGIAFPPLWFLVDALVSGLSSEFQSLIAYLAGRGVDPLGSPLDGFSRLSGIFLFVASVVAWRREADEPFWGHTFWLSLTVSLVYVAILALWYLRLAR